MAVEVVRKWRRRRDEALLVVDQLEELFTLNPPEIQARFAALLGRLADEADVHIVLAMRDDFLIHCHEHEALAPVFSELTPLLPPTGDALRRAVVEPARKHGFGFEGDGLVDEMLAAVGGERGALPMLAFTLARLWEQRDREKKLLTRQTYDQLGGVGGALAQHAEATLTRIGDERLPIVRELFRNLVTAQGTRAVREADELLSVFGSEGRSSSSRASEAPFPSSRASEASRGIPRSRVDGQMEASPAAGGHPSTRSPRSLAQDDRRGAAQGDGRGSARDDGRGAAEEVLRELVNARLLTSYEVHEEDHEPTRRVEIIHESLLTAWPRLVRWQTQDADAARLRDELRQAARLWDDHERSRDLLWTGRAYREYALWRESYPGGLTELEEAYAGAMTAHAKRRRRRRRAAAATAALLLGAVAAGFAWLWQHSVTQTRLATAQYLLSLGRQELETRNQPERLLAFAVTSLEMADTRQGRDLALYGALQGPLPFMTHEGGTINAQFSPDGRWLAASDFDTGEALLWPSKGGEPQRWKVLDPTGSRYFGILFTPDSSAVMTYSRWDPLVRFWSVPDGRLISTAAKGPFEVIEHGGQTLDEAKRWMSGYTVGYLLRSVRGGDGRWTLDPRGADALARIQPDVVVPADLSSASDLLVYAADRSLYVVPLEGPRGREPRLIGRHDKTVVSVRLDPEGRRVAAADSGGELRLWSLDGDGETPLRWWRGFVPDVSTLAFSPDGSVLVVVAWSWLKLLDLLGPPDAEPLVLKKRGLAVSVTFHPNGRWLAASGPSGVHVWPFDRDRITTVLRRHTALPQYVAFSPGGQWMVSSGMDQMVRWWPLDAEAGHSSRVLFEAPQQGTWSSPSVSINATHVAVAWGGTSVRVLPIGNGPALDLEGPGEPLDLVSIDREGRYLAACQTGSPVVRVWDLGTGGLASLDAGDGIGVAGLRMLPNGRLLVTLNADEGTYPGLGLWQVETARREQRFAGEPIRWFDDLPSFPASNDGRLVLGWQRDVADPTQRVLSLGDLETLTVRRLDAYAVLTAALDRRGEVVAAWGYAKQGPFLRVGPVGAPVPHLIPYLQGFELYGYMSFSPDGRRIARGYDDGSIWLYPVPDLNTPPLQSLPRDKLLERLRTFTNLRVVPDEGSDTGWKYEVGPFPGWKTVPTG